MFVIFVCFLTGLTLVESSCSHLSLENVTRCSSDLSIGIPTVNSPVVSHSDLDWLARDCGNGALITSVGCMEKVMDECRDSKSENAQLIRIMIDPKRVRGSINFLCASLKVYSSNMKCIAGHHDEQVACAQWARSQYQSEASAADSLETLVKSHCIFYKAMEECVQTVLQEKCSKEAAEIVINVMDGFRPPSCAITNRNVTTDRRVDKPTTDKGQMFDENKDGVKIDRSSCGSLSLNWIMLLTINFCLVIRSVRRTMSH